MYYVVLSLCCTLSVAAMSSLSPMLSISFCFLSLLFLSFSLLLIVRFFSLLNTYLLLVFSLVSRFIVGVGDYGTPSQVRFFSLFKSLIIPLTMSAAMSSLSPSCTLAPLLCSYAFFLSIMVLLWSALLLLLFLSCHVTI